MKKTGIVICNYNKKDYIINCIKSILESDTDDFDIYVADNASTDGSVEMIREIYGDKVKILLNSENKGGSGGFNLGIREVLKNDYKYLYCLDNDVLADEHAISALKDYLDQHENVGAAGSIVYHMDNPDYVQQYGLDLDFSKCSAITNLADTIHNDDIEPVHHCDTIATCSVMLRTDILKNTDVGIMPEDNFIYWDDMEWIYRFKLSGYDVVTIKDSVVLHAMGACKHQKNTFINYYMWRNRINFFMRYTEEKNLEKMSYMILSGVFDALYESMYRQEHNVMRTISFAYHDALCGIRGKADDAKILENDSVLHEKNKKFFSDKSSFYLSGYNIDNSQKDRILDYIYDIAPGIIQADNSDTADIKLYFCEYIMYIDDPKPDIIYIDMQNNMIVTDDDRMEIRDYKRSKNLFIYMNQAVFLSASEKIREKNPINLTGFLRLS